MCLTRVSDGYLDRVYAYEARGTRSQGHDQRRQLADVWIASTLIPGNNSAISISVMFELGSTRRKVENIG